MKDAESMMHELLAASIRLQECEYIAKQAGRADLVNEARNAGFIVAGMMRKIMASNCERETVLS